ncbi:hypothetical protein H6763_03540 [Candidatus Nomurabacteria bacterium]|uniref:Uncharacterized protein n=1 Tax=Candidatus Dojkabacteria bacterium TaxID=2099670 RepID=A0A955I524_9BACT|nr:hypothetical protein [Candidatus Dojkabacteria bacterium]MCB9789618.1 hypothetical protein [Candidatus Nomurabacteria bacterium]MCB9803877.1 hypothetical protein [Candidatus Nomurabacteria bacterium]
MSNKTKSNNNKDQSASTGTSAGQDGSKKQFFIDTIAKFCDKCGTEYSITDIHIVQESNFSSIIHFSCSNCKSNHIATFIRPMGMSSRVPVNSDLSVNEISRFAKFDKVTSDEVLQLYDELEKVEDRIIV